MPCRRHASSNEGGVTIAFPSTVRTVALLVGLLATAAPAPAQVLTKAQQKCLIAAAGGVPRLSGATFRSIAGCLADGAKGKLGGTVTACAAGDPTGAIAKANAKYAATFATRCTGTDKAGAPRRAPFGVTDPATVTAAAASAEAALVADALGIDLDAALVPAASDKAASKCQQSAVRSVGSCQAAWTKAFVGCAATGVKRKTMPITSGAALATCVGSDPKRTIEKACGKIATTLGKQCTRAGVAFPGVLPGCGGADATATAACLARAVACRTCRTLVTSADVAPDCDALDDGAANGSCPAGSPVPTATATSAATPTPSASPTPTVTATPLVIGPLTCPLDGFSSALAVSTHDFFLFRELAGAIDVECGTVDPATGLAACTCSIDGIEPVAVTGVGWACIRPAAGCPPGFVACRPGPSLDFMTDAHHTLGACTGNAGCAASCATTCGAAGTEVLTSGCEGYCSGGGNDGAACAGDLLCPGGVCNGPDHGIHGQICQCQCLGTSVDFAATSGLTCNLGVDVAVESTLPCGDGDIVLEIGPRCVPFTTGRTDTLIADADNVAMREVRPDGAFYGIPRACAALASDGPEGLTIAATAAFLDAPVIGDMAFTFVLTCGPELP